MEVCRESFRVCKRKIKLATRHLNGNKTVGMMLEKVKEIEDMLSSGLYHCCEMFLPY